jgi:acyl-CoA synthetase (AMP-forming)/AMP-acid ligase II
MDFDTIVNMSLGEAVSDRTTIQARDTAVIEDAATIWELLDLRARQSPDAGMLIDERDRTLTFGQFRARAERVAAGLHDLGIANGTRVTWQLPTRIETLLVSMALARLGAVQNPIIPIYREREVGAVLRQTAAEWAIVPSVWRGFDYGAMAEQLATQSSHPLRVLVVDDDLPETDAAGLPPAPVDGEEVRWIYSTSGTTSEPKGVRHTDKSLIAGGLGVAYAYHPEPDDLGSIAYPFAHIGGPDFLVMMLSRGLGAVLVESFVPEHALEVFRRHGVTIAGGSTAFYVAFLAEQRKTPTVAVLPTLRALTGGGAPKPPELFWQVRDELQVRVLHGYGMTECPMITSGSPEDTDEQLANTDGGPVRGCEIVVRDDHGTELAIGASGDVWVRGPMLCKGYTDSALNAESFDAEGFFRTGDVGYLRDDGHLVLVGRAKDMIIRKGENISPREIEDLLQEHPKVAAVAVIGLPDDERGERVCAVVELRHAGAALTLAEVQGHCRAAGIMIQKIPEQLEIVDSLPRNATLKILKTELRARFGAG